MRDPHALALGRLGASKGGHARALVLSTARRRKIGRRAAAARWSVPEAPGLPAVFRLERIWSAMKGSKSGLEHDLAAVISVLEKTKTRYALIGGLAVQARQREPRTTEDIDLAVPSWGEIPREELRRAGFTSGKRHQFSENWKGPGKTAVQFWIEASDLIARAEKLRSGRLSFRSAAVVDLLAIKALAASDPTRRLSKKLSDIKDVLDLLESYPAALGRLPAETRASVERIKALAAVLGAEQK